MLEYESFVYLDVEKTGSTFITSVLRKFCTEKEIRQKHHGRIGPRYDPGKFHFISVRNPLDAYLSLYSYGCQSSGAVRLRFENMGLEAYYDGTVDGFTNWLSFALKPANAEVLDGRYAKTNDGTIAKLVGLQSFRYLQLALPRARTILEECETRDDIRAAYASKRMPDYTIRHETLIEDLCTLFEGKLRHAMKDPEEAVRYVRESKPVNASARVDTKGAKLALSDKLRWRLKKREWFLNELYGY